MSKENKFLSRVLRHEPELVGLTLGTGGWVLVDDLLRGMKKAGHRLKLDELELIVADNDKRRFTLSEDGRRIRAAQGHSVAVEMDLPATAPPSELFHGTAAASLDAIWAEGIKPGRRQHVHLSSDPETATRVGQRHGRPVVLKIATGKMHADGHQFWQADNGVWLTDHVAPSETLSVPDRLEQNKIPILYISKQVLQLIEEFRERVRGDNKLSPDDRDAALEALETLHELTREANQMSEIPPEDLIENEDIHSWPRRFKSAIEENLQTVIDPKNLANAAVPTGLILGFGALGALIAGPAGFGAGSLLGHLITGQLKPGTAAKEIEKGWGNDS